MKPGNRLCISSGAAQPPRTLEAHPLIYCYILCKKKALVYSQELFLKVYLSFRIGEMRL